MTLAMATDLSEHCAAITASSLLNPTLSEVELLEPAQFKANLFAFC
jgi:hypothetical protein